MPATGVDATAGSVEGGSVEGDSVGGKVCDIEKLPEFPRSPPSAPATNVGPLILAD
jgi:hypothetical protein